MGCSVYVFLNKFYILYNSLLDFFFIYQELYHVHSDESLIQEKVAVIISCFIDSQIPPNIQIDISPDMAEKIVERKYERTPYLFREAQVKNYFSVFSFIT